MQRLLLIFFPLLFGDDNDDDDDDEQDEGDDADDGDDGDDSISESRLRSFRWSFRWSLLLYLTILSSIPRVTSWKKKIQKMSWVVVF